MSQDTMDSYDDGVRDAIKVMERFAVASHIIDAARALLNDQTERDARRKISKAARDLFIADPKKFCETAVKGASGTAILHQVCDGMCACGSECALDARHARSSTCWCDVLGCAGSGT